MSDMTQVLTCIADNLTNTGFKVSRNVLLSDGNTADLAASRTSFSRSTLSYITSTVPPNNIMKALFESGFCLGKKANWMPLLRGMQFGYLIVPAILTDNADRTLMESAAERPAKQWAMSEFPVVIDLAKPSRRIFPRCCKRGEHFIFLT